MLADLKFALRSLAKSPGFSCIAILTLALGIGANSGVFSYLSTMLTRPLPVENVQELVFISEHSEQVPGMSVSWPNYLDWRERQKSFTHLGISRGQSFNYVGPAETERVSGAQFSHDMFPVLGVAPRLGRWFGAEDDRPGAARTVVISDGFWQRAFGSSPDVLGQKITLSGEIYSVVGVMPASFIFPARSAEIWMPFGLFGDQNMERGNHPGL
jgi:putative ABC transport system permease protein